MTLIEFLEARISEDEDAARRAAQIPDRARPKPGDVTYPDRGDEPGVWGFGGGPFRIANVPQNLVAALGLVDSDAPYYVTAVEAWDESEPTGYRYDVATVPSDHDAARHIARWDPARVLAECQAKRDLIGQLEYAHPERGWCSCARCQFMMRTAAIYADHPDCREEWGGYAHREADQRPPMTAEELAAANEFLDSVLGPQE